MSFDSLPPLDFTQDAVSSRLPGPLPLSLLALWTDPVAAVAEGQILYANQALASYLGYHSAQELLGRTLEELVYPDDRAISSARVRTAMTTGKADPALIWRLLHRSGSLREADVGLLALGSGTLDAVVLVVRDLAQRKRIEEQLVAFDKAAALTGLAGSIAHEINNPIGYLLTNLEFAQEEITRVQNRLGELAELRETLPSGALVAEARKLQEVSEAIQDSVGGARRVARQVRSLRELSGEVGNVRRPLDLRSIVEAALDLVGSQLRQHSTLRCELNPAPLVSGNEPQLIHVLVTLLNRAKESVMAAEGSDHSVRVVTGTEATGAAFAEIWDSGRSPTPEQRVRLFELFREGESQTAGLGLPIAAAIARDHGGSLSLEATSPGGARIHLSLPPALNRPQAAPAAQRLRLLIVDDEVGYCVSLQRLLGKIYDVTIATKGLEALGRLQAGEPFDVILCDMIMPGMNGMQFAAALDGLPEALNGQPKPTLVFVTGGVFTLDAREFLRQPGVVHLQKPFNRQQLQEMIAGLGVGRSKN